MSSATPTTDHEEIRRWAEAHDAQPARVRGTGSGKGDPGILRLDLGEPEESLEQISWEDWFEAFEANGLALLISPDSGFNKLIARAK